jgi:hypothetical protein
MEVATWGLFAVTGLLVIFSALQTLSIRASARASRAIVDEMVLARREANPLRLRIDPLHLQVGAIGGYLRTDGDRAEMLVRSDWLMNGAVVETTPWENSYLAPQGEGQYFHHQFKVANGGLLTLRVTGRPEGGLEQTREFWFQILPGGQPKDLGAYGARSGDVAST